MRRLAAATALLLVTITPLRAAGDLVNARDRLRRIDPQRFPARERTEYVVGLGEALFFDGAYGAAANVFEPVLQSQDLLTGEARERVLDWWASAIDRGAKPDRERKSRSEIDRQGVYDRIRARYGGGARHASRQRSGGLLAGGARERARRSAGRAERRAGRLGPRAADKRSRRRAAPTSTASFSAPSSPIGQK